MRKTAKVLLGIMFVGVIGGARNSRPFRVDHSTNPGEARPTRRRLGLIGCLSGRLS